MKSCNQVEAQHANGTHVNISVPHHAPIQSFCSICFPCDDLHDKDLARVCPFVVFDKIAQARQFARLLGNSFQSNVFLHKIVGA